MTATLIIDCSMTMAWCFADEQSLVSAQVQERLVNETALVPAHWFLEVSNVLMMAEKRGRISASDTTQFVQFLSVLDIETDHDCAARCFDCLLPLCRSHRLTSYDAAYLDLALRRQLPLASLDRDLTRAAISLGVAVITD